MGLMLHFWPGMIQIWDSLYGPSTSAGHIMFPLNPETYIQRVRLQLLILRGTIDAIL
jgi:hypothetical protein